MAKAKKRKLHRNHVDGGRPTKVSKAQPSRPGPNSSKPHPPNKTHAEPTIPFTPESRILLVGEGDFSFAVSLLQHHGCCDLTATCFDSQTTLFEKYAPQAERNVQLLVEEGQRVLYNVDARKLGTHKALRKTAGGLFEVVLFNFPHVGGKSKDVNRQVRFNQELLVEFFTSVGELLVGEGGSIVVTLFEGEPYTLWNVRDLARHAGLEVVRSFRFVAEAYPGYSHARTLGNLEGGGGWKGEDREARSYVFRRRGGEAAKLRIHPERMAQMGQQRPKRKKGPHDESSTDEEG
nr:25S rRNA (uridine-N(3))-methyltransferase-like [Quercus suber]POF16379.1 25s rrna (uridine-n(3))-methyltransferase [Quercus suber]